MHPHIKPVRHLPQIGNNHRRRSSPLKRKKYPAPHSRQSPASRRAPPYSCRSFQGREAPRGRLSAQGRTAMSPGLNPCPHSLRISFSTLPAQPLLQGTRPRDDVVAIPFFTTSASCAPRASAWRTPKSRRAAVAFVESVIRPAAQPAWQLRSCQKAWAGSWKEPGTGIARQLLDNSSRCRQILRFIDNQYLRGARRHPAAPQRRLGKKSPPRWPIGRQGSNQPLVDQQARRVARHGIDLHTAV